MVARTVVEVEDGFRCEMPIFWERMVLRVRGILVTLAPPVGLSPVLPVVFVALGIP